MSRVPERGGFRRQAAGVRRPATGQASWGSVISVVLLMALTGPASRAAEPLWAKADAAPGAIESIPLDTLLEPVVTASRYEQEQWAAPSAVSVVSAEDIRQLGYRNLFEVLQGLRGAYATYDREYHYLGVRGVGVPGDYDNRVLLLINGVRSNDAIYQTAAVGRDLAVDLQLVKRVEFVRGPSSSIYGTDAFFGVVNLITKQGADIRGVRASADWGSLGDDRAFVLYGDRFRNGIDVVLSGTYGIRRGNDYTYFPEFDTPETGNGIVRGGDHERYAYLHGAVSWEGLSLEGWYSDRHKAFNTAPWGTIFGDPRGRDDDGRQLVRLQLDRTLPRGIEVLARVTYNRYTYVGDYPYEGDDGEEVVVNRDDVVGSSVTEELQLARTFLDTYRIIVGGQAEHLFQLDQKNYYLRETPVLDSHEKATMAAAYVQAELTFFKRLILNAGVRYDHYFGAWGGELSPRAAVMVRALPETTFKVMYGQAFRAPNAYERFYFSGDPTASDSQILNPDLQPERIRSVEGLVEQHLGKHVRLQVGSYYNRITGLISMNDVPLPPPDPRPDDWEQGYVLQMQNMEDLNAYGVEGEVEVNWRGFRAQASYAWQRAKNVQTGKTIANSPAHLAKLRLTVPLFKHRLFASVEALFMSERETVPVMNDEGQMVIGHAGANTRVNLTIFSQRLLKGLELSASIRNLLDDRYGDPGNSAHRQLLIPQDGRTFWLRAAYDLPL